MRDLFLATTRIDMATASPDEAVALGLANATRFRRTNVHRPAPNEAP